MISTKRAAVAGALSCGAMAPVAAQAHVKWFCAYDVAGAPRNLEGILCPQFENLVLLAMAFLLWGALLERSYLGPVLIARLDGLTAGLRANGEVIVRAVLGFLFVSLWNVGGVLLTPELKTTAGWVPWMQLGMAACLIWRRTTPLAALGIVVLFGMAVSSYGAFHLMDYPIFLGIAYFVATTAMGLKPFGVRPLDVMRWAAAITLMWASIEKWAYPQWTFPLIDSNPDMVAGFHEEFFMRAAGVVEFALSFALVWTPLVRRMAAMVLTVLFVSAIGGFGKIDAIGHSGIIAVMLLLVADDAPEGAPWRRVVYVPAFFAGALTVVLLAYYAAHEVIFSSSLA